LLLVPIAASWRDGPGLNQDSNEGRWRITPASGSILSSAPTIRAASVSCSASGCPAESSMVSDQNSRLVAGLLISAVTRSVVPACWTCPRTANVASRAGSSGVDRSALL
jgi:hypothetical protein